MLKLDDSDESRALLRISSRRFEDFSPLYFMRSNATGIEEGCARKNTFATSPIEGVSYIWYRPGPLLPPTCALRLHEQQEYPSGVMKVLLRQHAGYFQQLGSSSQDGTAAIATTDCYLARACFAIILDWESPGKRCVRQRARQE